MLREATTYFTVKKIINQSFTQEEIDEWLANPRDDHQIFDIIHKAAEMVKNNQTYQFSCYDGDDLYQLCWDWAYDVLIPKMDTKAGVVRAKYNYSTSLYGYLDTVFRNKIFKLRRDKQWRNDIAFQKTCKKCKESDTCPRKIYFVDKDRDYQCPIILEAIKRNEAKHALSVQMDDEITERQDVFINVDYEVMVNDIQAIFGLYIPEQRRSDFQALLHGETKLDKYTLGWLRRRCFKVLELKVHDEQEYIRFRGLLKLLFNREYKKKSRTKIRAKKRKVQRQNQPEQSITLPIIIPPEDHDE